MGATKAIADASDGPGLLAAYIVLARFAFGDRRDLVARQHPQLHTSLVQAGLYPSSHPQDPVHSIGSRRC